MPQSRHEGLEVFHLVGLCIERNDAEPQVRDALLKDQTVIDCDEDVETRGCESEELTVLFAAPAHAADRLNVMLGKLGGYFNRKALIKQHA